MTAVHAFVMAAALSWALLLVLGCVAAAVRASSAPGRVLAVDVLGLCLVAVLAILAVREREPAYLDGALALALLAFVGTLAAARFHWKGRLE